MESWRYIIAELAHAGFGSPEVLANERADLILDAHEYLVFHSKFSYQAQLMAMGDTTG